MTYFPKRTLGDSVLDPLVDDGGALDINDPSGPSASVDQSTSPDDNTAGTQGTLPTTGGQAAPTQTYAWQSVSGICIPTNTDAGIALLSVLKDLQRQLNRIAKVNTMAALQIDGKIGPATLTLLSKAYSGKTFTCENVCTWAARYVAEVSSIADKLGAGSVSSSAGEVVLYDPSTKTLVKQPAAASIGDVFNNLSTTEKLLAGGAALGLAYYLNKTSKKKGRR
jgi:hypothetical protein